MNIIKKIGFSSNPEEERFKKKIKQVIGFKPKNIAIYKIAFTHKSEGKKDIKNNSINYERLEFLGDALLDASITAFLFHNLPNSKEGDLTKMRSKIVRRKHLNEIGKNMKLVSFAKRPESRRKFSYNAHGDLFESLVAAVYLDRGYSVMDRFIKKKVIDVYVDLEKLQGKITSYKSLFIEWCQKQKKSYRFENYEDTGKSDTLHFSVKLFVNNELVAKGRSTSKKKAEETACKRAYYKYQNKM